jgi:RNA polymerase II subunit A C-terminal domain phosphatase
MKTLDARKSLDRRIQQSREPCRHPAIFKSMCVSCGLTVTPAAAVTAQNGSDYSSSSSSGHRSEQDSVSGGHSNGSTNSSSLLFAGGQRLLLSKEEALRVQQSKFLGLQSVRKLALVLDLDHTLVHATGAWPGYATSLGSLLGSNSNDIRRIFIEEAPGMQPKCYLVKSRPHLEAFLKEAHTLFQMTIYTAGTRLYAEAVAKLMDPLGIYFARRIVSRSDIPNDKSEGMEKSLQRIFLEDASMVAIMDDREDVWKGEQAAQLLLVRPFHYFTGCEEVNNAAGSPPVASGPLIRLSGDKPGSIIDPSARSLPGTICSDEQSAKSSTLNGQNDYDDQLPKCLEILKKIHETFFSSSSVSPIPKDIVDTNDSGVRLESSHGVEKKGRSVANIINKMKAPVLAGCTISFSGVIPVKSPAEQHPCWRLAESLGARVSSEVTQETTHLLSISMAPPRGAVGQSLGQQYLTSKAKECLVRGDVWVLHPDWLLYCRYCLARAEESTFMLVAQTPGKPYPNPKMRLYSEIIPPNLSSALAGEEAITDSRPSTYKKGVRFRDDVDDADSDNGSGFESFKRSKLESQDSGEDHDRDIDRFLESETQDLSDSPHEDNISSDEDNPNNADRQNLYEDDDGDEDGDDSDDGSFDNFDAIILQR